MSINVPAAAGIFMAFVVATVITPSLHSANAQSTAKQVPAGGLFKVEGKESVVIYGQRSRSCTSAPTFSWAMENAFREPGSQRPKHGSLSDGGTGLRYSAGCGDDVPVRVIVYTPDSGFVGTDTVVFWSKDRAEIVVTE